MSEPAGGLPAALRLQVGILLGFVFAAGLIGGLLLARVTNPPLDPIGMLGTDQVFFDRFSAGFGLDPGQRAALRLILEEKKREKNNWWNDHIQLQLQPRDRLPLLAIDRRADRRIRALLRPEQLNRYEEGATLR